MAGATKENENKCSSPIIFVNLTPLKPCSESQDRDPNSADFYFLLQPRATQERTHKSIAQNTA